MNVQKQNATQPTYSKDILEKIRNAKSYIGNRGYIIRKSFLTEKDLKMIYSDCNVKPNIPDDYGAQIEPFKVYLENDSKIYLPKFYGIDKFGPPEVNILPPGKDINIDFSLNLKEEQKLPAKKTIEAYHSKGGGILCLPCGFGKTILALYFIAQLKKKTLVIVHKEFLMNQWIERIKFALPTAKIGLVQGNLCQIAESDIVIGMLQTLSMKEFPPNTFDDIGHVIIDECHCIPSRVFSRALLKVNSPYMLGLSATPNRKDGLTKVLKWYVGDMIHTVKSFDKNVVKVERYLLESSFAGYNEDVLNFRGKPQMATMVNNIANYGKRTEFMMKIILESLAGSEKRQILVLSDRKQNLADMHKIATQKGMTSVGYYIGGMKKDDLKKSESCRLLLGTFAMAKEGLDIPTLNGLVLACPKSDIIQAIGRIDRVVHEGIQPIIIDIVDQFSVFESQARKRFQVFKKKKHQIEDIVVNLETGFIKSRQSYNFHNMPCLQDKEDDEDNNQEQQIDFKEEDDANEDFEDDFEIDFDTSKNTTKNNSNNTNNTTTKPRECMFDVEGSFPVEKSDKVYPPRKFNKSYSKPKTSSDENPTNNKSSYPTKRRVPYKKNVADMTTQERTQFVDKMFERINAFTD